MVTDAILTALLALVQAAWALVPAWTVTIPAFENLCAWLSHWDKLAPFTELFSIIGIVGGFFSAMVGVKVVVKVVDWITNVIP